MIDTVVVVSSAIIPVSQISSREVENAFTISLTTVQIFTNLSTKGRQWDHVHISDFPICDTNLMLRILLKVVHILLKKSVKMEPSLFFSLKV